MERVVRYLMGGRADQTGDGQIAVTVDARGVVLAAVNDVFLGDLDPILAAGTAHRGDGAADRRRWMRKHAEALRAAYAEARRRAEAEAEAVPVWIRLPPPDGEGALVEAGLFLGHDAG